MSAADSARYRRAVVEIVPLTDGDKNGAEAARPDERGAGGVALVEHEPTD